MTGTITTTAANATSEYLNASNSLMAATGDAYGLAGTALVVLVVAVALVFIGSSVQRIEWLHKKIQAFSRSLYYTTVGLATTVVLAVFAVPVYLLAQADGETQGMIGMVLGGVVGAYVVLTGLGWVVDRTLMTNVRAYLEEVDTED